MMSTPTYLAWSLATSGFFTLLVYVSVRFLGGDTWIIPATDRARRKRLQQSLDARLARGTDRAAGELDAIQTAIAALDRPSGSKAIHAVFSVMTALLIGAVICNLLAVPVLEHRAPPWSNNIWFAAVALYGAHMVIEPTSTRLTPPKVRLLGALVIGIAVTLQFSHLV
jgi:hypothetical protein